MVLQLNRGRQIAISGSFGTGKSTLAKELSGHLGLPLVQPRAGPEIFRELFPNADLRMNTPPQIFQVGVTRLMERMSLERLHAATGFVSDGSALTEWAYGVARKEFGYGSEKLGREFAGSEFAFAVDSLGDLVRRHMRSYSAIIHLPIEFPMSGSNPEHIDEAFRRRTDDVLREALAGLDIPYVVLGGNVEERVNRTLEVIGATKSLTKDGPRREGNVLVYDDIDDALGPERTRFFSYGFRNVSHNIRDVRVDPENSRITALVDIVYTGPWSTKGGKTRTDIHATSLDAIRIAGQLVQILMYTKDGITREQSSNLWLREVTIRATKPIETFVGIPIEMTIDSKYHRRRGQDDGPFSHFADVRAVMGNGAFVLEGKVCYVLPEGVTPQV